MPFIRNVILFLSALVFLAAKQASAQSVATPPVARIDESRLVTLRGTVHPFAQPVSDRGAVPDSFPANRMLVILKRAPDREAALQRFLRDVHLPGSAQYHNWVTPGEFGARFGPADSEIQTVVQWLQSHGFTVPRVSQSRNFIEFSGTAGQVREALHTQIHEYQVNGETHYSIASEAAIPEPLAPLIYGFAPLNNFEYDHYVHPVGKATYSRASKRVTPEFTIERNAQPFYALGPEDFATQYDLEPVYKSGIDGTGQTIGIIGAANINLALVDAYRALFSLPADNTQVVIDGEDPGPALGPNVEGFLDVEVSGSVAPKATINFYIAGGTPFGSALIPAAVRAVEDNQASVLSVSFGSCEQVLGESNNQIWNTLWEQAAAQGQTVLVASGDTGPATCPLATISSGMETFYPLGANGLSSTPWNVSVGGTDFYYSDYASGAPSAATLWNQSNDSSLGSLKAPLPEQPWDNVFGFNITAFSPTSFGIPSNAAGGGPSSCAQSAPNPNPPGLATCIAGYPKPSWQNAPGVPNDAVRDLPDVSLFAAPGKNLSAYPICADPGDCVAAGSGESQIFLVGGTSASTPAMAGIMALINQKTGSRQGQADFVFYALARQQPAVYHDITIGTNDVLCDLQSPYCIVPMPSTPGAGSYGVNAAGPGYDMATGLGSVDANALLNDWGSITFLPTATSLQLSPATIVHGSPVSVAVSVQSSAAPAGSTPSGDVDIASTATVPLPEGSAALSLSGGSANAVINLFPGGTYRVTAQYAGDGVFGPSSSNSTTLTVTPEPSSTNLAVAYSYVDYSTIPPTAQNGTVVNGASLPFGTQWAFESRPFGLNSQTRGLATGSVTFTDGQTSVEAPVRALGSAVWSPQMLAIGAHSVGASYSGDASYGPSTAPAINFTVVKGTPRLAVSPEALGSISPPSTTLTYVAGSTLVVHVLMGAAEVPLSPTGSVTVNLGSQSQTLPLTPEAYINQGLSTAFFTFANVPAGTYSLSASYAGDANWNAASFTDPNPLTFAMMNAAATMTTVTVSPSNATSADSVTFTVSVTAAAGSTQAPVGPIELFANGTIFWNILEIKPVAANSLTASATVTVPGSEIPAGTLQVLANYQGLPPSFAPSTSAPVSLTMTPVDFSLSISADRVVIPAGQSATVPVLLRGPNGGSVHLTLACAPSTGTFGCFVNQPPSSVSGVTSSTLSINAFITLGGEIFVPNGPSNRGPLMLGAISGVALVFLLVVATGEKKLRAWAACSLAILGLALVTFAGGCGGGSTIGGPPGPKTVNTPPGTYSVVVTGTSGGVTHNAKITVIVQ